MSRRAIDRSEWTNFADAFSRPHDGWLISVAVAASVAGVLLLSEATLTEIEEKREEPQPVGAEM